MPAENPFDYVNNHSHTHVDRGADPLDLNTTFPVANPARGDIIVSMGSSPKWGRYALLTPAANVRNALGVDNGDTEPTWKTTLDSTNPTTIGVGDAAAPGTSLIYSHRDHRHGSPTTYTATAHNLLSTTHGDTLAGTVVRGDVIYGNSTPAWARLAKPSTPAVLYNDATDVAWDTMVWTGVSFNAGDFTASAGTWTVAAGDVVSFAYRLLGKTMIVGFAISTSTTSSTPAVLAILIPASKTANRYVYSGCQVVDNGTYASGYCYVAGGGTTINIAKSDGTNFAVATDTTWVLGSLTFETT